MIRPDSPQHQARERTRIAVEAARLIAESGLTDYTQAKRKALRRLGLPEGSELPDNVELEDELRRYQRLFQDEEQRERIAYLRRKAYEVMLIVRQFTPYLVGSVLTGSAGREAEIDIQLYADSAKDVEIFLLNQQIEYEHCVPRSEQAEAVLSLFWEEAMVNLVVYPPKFERITFKTRDGRVRQRARLDVVARLIEEEASADLESLEKAP